MFHHMACILPPVDGMKKCDGHNYSNRLVPTIVHHEASIKQEWKVDKKLMMKKIITGYQCAVVKQNNLCFYTF